MMKSLWFAGATMFACASALAGAISGFENGLSEWTSIGDVSIQTSSSGIAPTQGRQFALISTIGGYGDQDPFSGTYSPSSPIARQFLGVGSNYDFLSSMPLAPGAVWIDMDSTYAVPRPGGGYAEYGMVGESGALKVRFFAPQAGRVSFDWNRIGLDADNAFLTLWSDEPANNLRFNDWVLDLFTFEGAFTRSAMNLCAHATPCAEDPAGHDFYNWETGWHTKSVSVQHAGWYWLGIGLGEVAESTSPTALALDNFRFNVPEPSSFSLLAMAIVGLGVTKRHRFGRRQQLQPL